MTISKRSPIVTIKKNPVFRTFNQKNGIQRLLLEGKIEGKRGHERPRMMWMDNIKNWTGLKYGVCVCVCVQRAKDQIE